MEVDTLFIGYPGTQGLVTPAQITGDTPLPIALEASTYKGMLYGVPNWLCMDFIFSYQPSLRSVHTIDDLVAFVQKNRKGGPALLADYDGVVANAFDRATTF